MVLTIALFGLSISHSYAQQNYRIWLETGQGYRVGYDFGTFGSSSTTLQDCIDFIKERANGADCEIQLGRTLNEPLEMGGGAGIKMEFSGNWGAITLWGKATYSGTTPGSVFGNNGINIGSGISVNSRADLTATDSAPGFWVAPGGTLTISGGTVKKTGEKNGAVFNFGTLNVTNGIVITTANVAGAICNYEELNVSGGTVQATGNASSAIYIVMTPADGKKVIISGTALVTSVNKGYYDGGTIFLNEDDENWGDILEIRGGKVENTAGGNAIFNDSKSSIEISGGKVESSNVTVYMNNIGNLKVKGGEIIASGIGLGIGNLSSGSITIEGGIVKSMQGPAIQNNSTGKITITGNALVTSQCDQESNGTIYVSAQLEMTGGTVENTHTNGNAIFNGGTGAIEISGGVVLAKYGFAVKKHFATGTSNINNNAILFAYGTTDTHVISGTYNMTGNAVITAWNEAAGTTVYLPNTNTHIYKYPATASAVWDNFENVSGISVTHNTNSGFIPVKAVDVYVLVPFEGGNGSQETPYLIATPAQLKTLANYVNVGDAEYTNKHYKLMNSIDLSDYQAGDGWTPIGFRRYPNPAAKVFKGVFDGNNKKITGLKINNPMLGYVGLFGSIDGGTVKNLGVENVNIEGYGEAGVGGIAGHFVNGSVSNCYVTGVVRCILGNYPQIGGLAGVVGNNSTITDCYSTAVVNCNVNGSDDGGAVAGGLVGAIAASTINKCYSTGEVSARYSGMSASEAGGLVGRLYSGTISNCYSMGDVKSSSNSVGDTFAGGIAANNSGGGIIKNCWASGTVTASAGYYSTAGGIVAYNSGSRVENCAALSPQIIVDGLGTNCARVGTGTGTFTNNTAFADMLNPSGDIEWGNIGINNNDGDNLTKEQIHADGTLEGRFTSANGWTIQNGKLPGLFGNSVAMPFHLLKGSGTENDPYQITTAEQLAMLSSIVNEKNTAFNNKSYILMNDINLSDYQAGESWIPIGISDVRVENGIIGEIYFYGNFDGNNKKITGLKINSTTGFVAGLFGRVSGGTIKNLVIENADIIFNTSLDFEYFSYSTGILAASIINGGIVSHCYTTGNICVNGHNRCYSHVGGVVGGISDESVINNCYSTATVYNYSEYSSTGGIVGSAYPESTISNCYSTGDITSHIYQNSEFSSFAGGIAGVVSNNSALSNCYSTGSIISIGAHTSAFVRAGGVAGYTQFSELFNCAALNPSIDVTTNSTKLFGRVAVGEIDNLTNNIGFDKMLNPNGNTIWLNKGLDNFDGQDITKEQIHADGTLGGLFLSHVWTTQNGKLPGLFGNTVDMPAHLWLTSIAVETVSGVRVYPNPTTGQLRITNYELKGIGVIEIYDVAGRVVFTSSLSLLSPETALDITHLPAGIYFVKVGKEMVKVVKK